MALYTGGLLLLWAESSADPLIGQILLRPTSHPSHLIPAGLVHRIPHLGSGVCDPPILLLGALPQPLPLFHAPVKNDQRPRDREQTQGFTSCLNTGDKWGVGDRQSSAGRAGRAGGSGHQSWLWLQPPLLSQAGLCCRSCKVTASQWGLSLGVPIRSSAPASYGFICHDSSTIGATVCTCHLWVKETAPS